MEKTNVLIVEGKEDQSLVCALLKKNLDATIGTYPNPKPITINDKPYFQILDADGVDNAKKRFKQFIKERDKYGVVGLMVDVDEEKKENIESRWQYFRDSSNEYGYNLAKEFDKDSLIFASQAGFPKIGLWLMPDNESNGMMEDFAISIIKGDDTLLPYSKTTIEHLPEKRFKESYNSKAILHTWLAWQEYPNADIWRGIGNDYFDTTHKLCKEFLKWVDDLFR